MTSALLLTVTLSLAACGEEAAGAGPDDPFGDAVWRLVSGGVDGAELDLLDTHPVTITRTDEGVGGTAACNSYGGSLAIDGASISISDLFGTMMACFPDEVMVLESAYLNGLGRVGTIAVGDDTLTLTLAGDGVLLVFEAQAPPPDATLEGTTWTLDTIFDEEVASSTAGDAKSTLLIADGAISGSTGCNTFNGAVTVGDDSLSTGELATTRMACAPAVMGQETAVLAVLSGDPAFGVKGPILTLTLPDGRGLIYRAF